jgi:hypothetical protein
LEQLQENRGASGLRVVPFDPNGAEQWDEFVWQSNNGTLFHTRAFLAYHPPARFHDGSLLFFKDGKLLAVLPAATRPGENDPILRSHPGASFGGFVTGSSLALHDAERLVAYFLACCRESGYAGVELSLPPQIYPARPGNYLEFLLYRHGFRYRKRELSGFVPLDFPAERVLDFFSPESRRKVQRAQKLGVQVRENDDWPAFYEILQESRKRRYNIQPTHTLDELIELHKMFPERIRLFTAHVENEMIAGIVIFVCNQRVALSFYVSHRQAFQQYRSVNLLFYEVMRWCIEQGLRFLDFGTFTINMQPNWGLARFEEGLGAQGIFRDTMGLEL